MIYYMPTKKKELSEEHAIKLMTRRRNCIQKYRKSYKNKTISFSNPLVQEIPKKKIYKKKTKATEALIIIEEPIIQNPIIEEPLQPKKKRTYKKKTNTAETVPIVEEPIVEQPIVEPIIEEPIVETTQPKKKKVYKKKVDTVDTLEPDVPVIEPKKRVYKKKTVIEEPTI